MPVLPYGSGKQTNVTGTAANITGTLAVAQGGTGATANTGTGNVVLSTSPTIATPAITGNMTVTGTNQDQGTNLQTIRSETTSDYVASGAVWTISSGLIGTMTAGVVYIGGKRVPVTLITSKTFSTSFDTYVSVDNTGTVTYTAVANGAASPSLPANSTWLAKIITGVSAITTIQINNRTSLGSPIRPQSPSTQSAYAIDAVQHTYSTSQTLVTVSLANAPAGDYVISGGFAILPNGGGNCSVNISHNSATGVLAGVANAMSGIHGSDADWITTKYAHRTIINTLQGHQGGLFSVSLVFTPETAVAFQIGNSGDARWATVLSVVKA